MKIDIIDWNSLPIHDDIDMNWNSLIIYDAYFHDDYNINYGINNDNNDTNNVINDIFIGKLKVECRDNMKWA